MQHLDKVMLHIDDSLLQGSPFPAISFLSRQICNWQKCEGPVNRHSRLQYKETQSSTLLELVEGTWHPCTLFKAALATDTDKFRSFPRAQGGKDSQLVY
jgi:hypothetical protein